MMKQYSVSGIQKATEYCPSCKYGKVFSNEQRIKTDTMCGDTYERICGKCLTKYKIPYVQAGFDVEAFPGRQISMSTLLKWAQSNDGRLDDTNQAFHTISIGMEHNRQVKDMEKSINGEYLAQLREHYDKTSVCNCAIQVESKPFSTSEGKFTIKSCAVCKEGSVIYNGKRYKDTISNLVRFISHMGIQNDIKQEINLSNLFTRVKEEVPVFNVVEETPLFEIVEETPVFEVEIPVF